MVKVDGRKEAFKREKKNKGENEIAYFLEPQTVRAGTGQLLAGFHGVKTVVAGGFLKVI